MRNRVHRWNGWLAGVLVLAGVALLWGNRLLLAASAIPLVYVIYGALSAVSGDTAVTVRRRVRDGQPTPGEPVTVELTVENTGAATVTDGRVVDGVPDELAVVEGVPRGCFSLQPGDSTTVVYAVLAKRGRYAFDTTAVRVRTLSASDELTAEVTAEGDGALTCANTVSEVPLSDAWLPRAGTLPTDSGGSGLEFHSTRSYQHGDPVNRIDWRRYAKSDELTTINYREEQAVRTVLLVDARSAARVTPEAGYPTGAELGAYAAERLYDALSSVNVVVSVAAVGLDDEDVPGGLGPDGLAWVDETDDHADARVSSVFDGVGAAVVRDVAADEEPIPPENRKSALTTDGGFADDPVAALLARLPPMAQVVVCSPVTDEWAGSLVETLSVHGYATTLLSPDVARRDTLGTSVFAIERTTRLRRADLAGAAVVDWDLDSSIDVALRASLAELFTV